MGWAGNNSQATCPFINDEDHRCDQRLTLRRLDQAFSYCLGGYLACATYQQLTWEKQPLELSDHQPADAPARPQPPAAAGQGAPSQPLTLVGGGSVARRPPAGGPPAPARPAAPRPAADPARAAAGR